MTYHASQPSDRGNSGPVAAVVAANILPRAAYRTPSERARSYDQLHVTDGGSFHRNPFANDASDAKETDHAADADRRRDGPEDTANNSGTPA